MSITAAKPSPVHIDPDPTAVDVEVSDAARRIVLSDGRELSAPLAWFPRLRDATPAQRQNWILSGVAAAFATPATSGATVAARIYRRVDRGSAHAGRRYWDVSLG